MICETISAMTALCERGLFDLRLMMSALKQIVPYLIHPVSPVSVSIVACDFLVLDIRISGLAMQLLGLCWPLLSS